MEGFYKKIFKSLLLFFLVVICSFSVIANNKDGLLNAERKNIDKILMDYKKDGALSKAKKEEMGRILSKILKRPRDGSISKSDKKRLEKIFNIIGSEISKQKQENECSIRLRISFEKGNSKQDSLVNGKLTNVENKGDIIVDDKTVNRCMSLYCILDKALKSAGINLNWDSEFNLIEQIFMLDWVGSGKDLLKFNIPDGVSFDLEKKKVKKLKEILKNVNSNKIRIDKECFLKAKEKVLNHFKKSEKDSEKYYKHEVEKIGKTDKEKLAYIKDRKKRQIAGMNFKDSKKRDRELKKIENKKLTKKDRDEIDENLKKMKQSIEVQKRKVSVLDDIKYTDINSLDGLNVEM